MNEYSKVDLEGHYIKMLVYRAKRFLTNVKKYGPGYFWEKILEKLGLKKEDAYRTYSEEYALHLTPEEREEELKEWFQGRVGYPLDLDNPKTFDEKIQWLKLYDSTPIKTQLADKYLVRDWVAEQIGEQYLIPLLGVWDSFDAIDFTGLPEKFVLKANHGSGMNLIIKDKSKIDLNEMKRQVNEWFDIDYGIGLGQEWHYLHTKKKVLAEKFLEIGTESPPDYKVYCFNGDPKYVQYIEGRSSDSKVSFYDRKWVIMPFTYIFHGQERPKPHDIKKPKQLEKMLDFSRRLSKGFAFVRIDWYLIGDQDLFFGEMTFTPASGTQEWIPHETDAMLGSLIELPKEKYIVQ